ncbi:MAG: LysR substrate-binding domain-containing protein, partial [Pseudomonadota bacterium]
FLVAAAERFPDAQFEVESGVSADLLARVQAARLDAAVITETPDLPRALRFEPLAREAFALAAPAGAAGQGLRACAGTLAYVRFQPSTGIGLIVDTYLQRLDCAVSETVTLDSVEAVMGCVEAGLGFAVVPEPDARRYARRAHVSRLADPPLERHVVLAGRPAGEAGVDIAPLADLLRAALGNSQS